MLSPHINCGSGNGATSRSTLIPLWYDDNEGRRHVVPYMHCLSVRAKGRWLNRTILDVFSREFPHHTVEYYQAAIAQGRLYATQPHQANKAFHAKPKQRSSVVVVDEGTGHWDQSPSAAEALTTVPAAGHQTSIGNSVIDASRDLIRRDTIIHHVFHKHELSVFSTAKVVLESVFLDDDHTYRGLVVFNKPPSLPTHSSGRYHFNSLLSMAQYCLAHVDHFDECTSTAATEQAAWRQLSPRDILDATRLPQGQRQALRDFISKHEAMCMQEGFHTFPLRACHRLDKSTSGVLICALTQEAARVVGDLLHNKTKEVERMVEASIEADAAQQIIDRLHTFGILKTYVARVTGRFPLGVAGRPSQEAFPKGTCDWRSLHCLAESSPHSTSTCKGGWLLTSPLEVLQKWKDDEEEVASTASTSNGPAPRPTKRQREAESGEGDEVEAKEMQTAVTLFELIAHSPEQNESLVKCIPLTGRTHQIRRHLRDLGHPISNDTKYNPEAKSAARLESKELFYRPEVLPQALREIVEQPRREEGGEKITQGVLSDPLCCECSGELAVSRSGDAESFLFLHAWRYMVEWPHSCVDGVEAQSGDSQRRTFEATLPTWASTFCTDPS